MFINGAFVSPERRSPVARTNRKRRSPTAPSGRRSIAAGWSNAVDLTGVRLKRSTTGMATSYGLRSTCRLPSRGPRSVSLTCPVRGDPHADRAGTDQVRRTRLEATSHAVRARLHEPRELRRGARTDLVRGLGLHRTDRGAPGTGRLHRPRPGGRVDLHHPERGAGSARVLQRVQPPRNEVPRRRAGGRSYPQGVRLSVPRVGVRPERAVGRDAEREGGRAIRPERFPAARVRG